MKSWKERLEEYERLTVKSNEEEDVGLAHLADLEVLPHEIHEELLRVLLYYQQQRVWDEEYQPTFFHVSQNMRHNVVTKVIRDLLYFSVYYSYLESYRGTFRMNKIMYSNLDFAYSKVRQEFQKIFPDFHFFEILQDIRFSHFLYHLIVYPKHAADIDKIKGLIRLHQFDTEGELASIFHKPVKFLEDGFAFRIGFPENLPLHLDEIIDMLEPFEFDLIQSTLPVGPTWSDTIFDRLTCNSLELFLGDIYQAHNKVQKYVMYDQTQQIFKLLDFNTDDEEQIEFSVDLTITHPDVKVYTVHPEILTIHTEYDVPVNEYDIASFSIDHEDYRLPQVPEELEDDNLSELIEKCKKEKVYKFIRK